MREAVMKKELEAIMREAGQIILSAHDIDLAVSEKEGTANFVTEYDVKVQRLLKEKLLQLKPEAHFVGEEEDARDDVLHGEAFIVDPIDGTSNFIFNLRSSAISVAYLKDGEVAEAATYNPYQDKYFYAKKGCGATCNGRKIHVSSRRLKDSLVCFGTSPYYEELHEITFDLARRLQKEALDLRRSGSAVIDLCEVAQGHAGLLFELKLSPWDYAASSLIITEAGGRISQADGSSIVFDRPCSIIAGAPQAYDDFFKVIKVPAL